MLSEIKCYFAELNAPWNVEWLIVGVTDYRLTAANVSTSAVAYQMPVA